MIVFEVCANIMNFCHVSYHAIIAVVTSDPFALSMFTSTELRPVHQTLMTRISIHRPKRHEKRDYKETVNSGGSTKRLGLA